VEPLARADLQSVPVLVAADGFPGELEREDVARARLLAESFDAPAVVVATGAGSFWWVDAVGECEVRLAGAGGTYSSDGFALGTGDGATLAGMPLDWDLLSFVCPEDDTTVLLAQYPVVPPRCPVHDVPLALRE
jgi:hypothetical protein